MTGADHPDSGGTLDHLDLLPQLETDCLPLVDVEVNSMLASPVLTAPSALAHRHRHAGWLTRLAARLAGLVGVVGAGVGGAALVGGVAGRVGIVWFLPVLQAWREGAHVVCLSGVTRVGGVIAGPVTSVAPVT